MPRRRSHNRPTRLVLDKIDGRHIATRLRRRREGRRVLLVAGAVVLLVVLLGLLALV